MLITRKEYGEISIHELKESQVGQLQRQAEIAARRLRIHQNEIFYVARKSLKLGSVVGILSIPNKTIEVLPKIDGDHAKARMALIQMLAVAHDLPVSEHDYASLQSQPYDLLEFLIKVFSSRLDSAIRKGMPRRYEFMQDDLSRIRGRLNVVRQFSRYAGRADRLACMWDELTENTPLNRVMKATVQLLLILTKTADNRRRLTAVLERYDSVSDSRDPLQENVLLDRINSEFHDLYRIARFFLSRRYQSTTSGTGVGIALLFTMNELFENFVGKSLKRALQPRGFNVYLQHSKYHAIENVRHSGLFSLRPDVVIESNKSKEQIVLDTKWKWLDRTDSKRKVQQADIYQILAYGRAYDASRVILLYPWHTDYGESRKGISDQWKSAGTPSFAVDIATVDIQEPKCVVAELTRLFGPMSA